MARRTATRIPLALLTAWMSVSGAFLLALLGAAAFGRRRSPAAAPGFRLAVLMPAHDEAATIATALTALRAAVTPETTVRVIADNCTDETAALVRAAGFEPWERDAPAAPGKGRALAWAIARLKDEGRWESLDAVVVLDADCEISADGLERLGAWLAAGADAVQSDYVVSNHEESPTAALRAGAFSLMNTVRPQGKEQLGLSAGLNGTGMAFRLETLDAVPWEAFSITEDTEYHARLVRTGARVAFAHDVEVRSPMPTTRAASRTQQARWESGSASSARSYATALLRDGARAGSHVQIGAGLDLLVPPQSLLALGNAGALVGALAVRSRTLRRMATFGLLAQITFVLGGLAWVRAPAAVWRALLQAPLLIAEKVLIVGRAALGRGPREFVRTERAPS